MTKHHAHVKAYKRVCYMAKHHAHVMQYIILSGNNNRGHAGAHVLAYYNRAVNTVPVKGKSLKAARKTAFNQDLSGVRYCNLSIEDYRAMVQRILIQCAIYTHTHCSIEPAKSVLGSVNGNDAVLVQEWLVRNNTIFIDSAGKIKGLNNKKRIRDLETNTVELDRLANDLWYTDGVDGVDANTISSVDNSIGGSLYLYRWEFNGRNGYYDSFLKFGITTRDHEKRIKEQSRETGYKATLIVSKAMPTIEDARNLETTIKRTLVCGVVDKDVFPDGYTETLEDNMASMEALLKILV